MGDSKEQWSAADIFKARILDAWVQYPENVPTDDLVGYVGAGLMRDGLLRPGGCTTAGLLLLERARKEGVL